MRSGVELLAHRRREPAGAAQGALVLLHGRGADENDLWPLFDALDPKRRLLGIAPRAPLTLPPGGAHWYVSRRVGYPDRDTFLATFALVERWLQAMSEETGVPVEDTVIAGFSQGAVMSYSLALGTGRPKPRALVAMSGFMPDVEGFELDLHDRSDLPVAIAHGIYDPVIGVEWSRQARERLEAAGADVLYRESPMAHPIDPSFLGDAAALLSS